jgi:hypothetical protein
MAAFEVIALDTATPQLRAPGAADTYTFPRAVEMPLGTANGVLYLNGSKVVTSGSALTFDGTNLGVGTAPSGRLHTLVGSSPNAAQILSGFSGLSANYFDANENIFRNGAFSEQMRLTSTGLGIGTSSPARKLDVNGSIRITDGQSIEWGGTSLYIAGSSNTLIFGTSSSEKMRLDSSGNLGLGVTPSAWNTAYRAIDMGSGAIMATPNGSDIYYTQNAYYGTGNTWVYKFSGTLAARYQQVAGVHSWLTAPSGTAGNTISFTQAMTLDASGRLLLGTTSATGASMDIQGSAAGALTLLNIQNTSIDVAAISRLAIGSQGANWFIDNERNGGLLKFSRGASLYLTMDNVGNIIQGSGAIATNATDGFLYVPGCAGTPTGTPTAYTGRVPIVVNTTNNKLYFYSGGQWRDAGP